MVAKAKPLKAPRKTVLIVLICIVPIVVLALGYSAHAFGSEFNPTSVSAQNEQSDGLQILCSMTENELSSFVWSHRGSWQGLTDSSSEAVEMLAEHGIIRFDVDVSVMNVSKAEMIDTDSEFWIAHPSTLNDRMHSVNGLQRLDSFLSQTVTSVQRLLNGGDAKTCLESNTIPLVILEPKFSQKSLLEQ
jgi:hypothetical protein